MIQESIHVEDVSGQHISQLEDPLTQHFHAPIELTRKEKTRYWRLVRAWVSATRLWCTHSEWHYKKTR
jgi:hypothetical protein